MHKAIRLAALSLASSLFSFTAVNSARAQYAQPTTNPSAPFTNHNDPNGNPIRMAKATGHISNYTEELIPKYTLPDVLKLNNGQPVKDAATWNNQRRAEILKMYRDEIYGNVPATAPTVHWKVVSTDEHARGDTAIQKIVVGQIGEKEDGPKINLTLYLPQKSTGPVPVILTINFNFGGGGGLARGRGPASAPAGGAAVARGPARGPATAPGRGRGPGGGFDITTETLAKGWAFGTIIYDDIQPDNLQGLTRGVIAASFAPGQTERKPEEWGSISAWAWGISRTVDYFETDSSIDAKRVAIQGHSRLGKTVLWAGAQDQRIAVVFSSCGGEMGSALARRDYGETVDDMAQNYPWQFAGNFQKYVGHWNDMPGDSHFVVSLVAPRPLFLNGGVGDQWSDPHGEFLGAVAANPVWTLLGVKGLETTDLPAIDHPIIDGNIGWQYHSEGHVTSTSDWRAFLKFLDKPFTK